MLKQNSIAGTMESNDIMIELFNDQVGRLIELESNVKEQFGDEILRIINETLDEYQIDNVKVDAEKAKTILKEHIGNGKIVEEYTIDSVK